jgi:hypothetical protein
VGAWWDSQVLAEIEASCWWPAGELRWGLKLDGFITGLKFCLILFPNLRKNFRVQDGDGGLSFSQRNTNINVNECISILVGIFDLESKKA